MVHNNFSSENPSWKQANAGMRDLRVTDMDLRKGDNTVFISTYGLGIYSGEFKNNEPTFTISSTKKQLIFFGQKKDHLKLIILLLNDFNEECYISQFLDYLQTNYTNYILIKKLFY